MKVLVIDDDSQIRLMLREVLVWAGYEVFEAENGREGLLQQRRHPVDLVITDLIMPEQEGLETIAALKTHLRFQPDTRFGKFAARPHAHRVSEPVFHIFWMRAAAHRFTMRVENERGDVRQIMRDH